MGWKAVRIGEEQLGRNIPAVSVGHLRLSLNISACDLLNQRTEKFTHVQFYTDDDNPTVVAMRFWKEARNEFCVPLKQKELKGKPVGGVEVVNGNLLKSIFGDVAAKNTVTHYRVHMEEKYLMVIDLES